MSSEFWSNYDRMLAGRKDYDAEVAVVAPLLGDAKLILEIGCGTGEHTKRLAKHFPAVVALDMNEDAVEIARKKKAPNTILLHSRLEDFMGTGFDGAVALFNVVHYLQTERWLTSFMESLAKKLKPGSPFVFDCWNAEAVMNDPPKAETDDMGIERVPTWDAEAGTVEVRMTIPTDHGPSVHWIFHKLWTPGFLLGALMAAGFVNIRIARWMKPAEEATIADWKVMFICERGV